MNIPPEGWKLLNAIAGTESPGYDVLYGGQRFSDYSRHPGVYNTITSGPNKGKKSSAAGRYQFLESTWNNAQNALGLPDFSPQSQDQAAWWLANQDYKRRTGRDLSVDVGNREMLPLIRQNLGGTWEGLTKINDSQMFPMFDRAPPVAPGQNTVETAAKGLTLNSTPMNGPTVAAAASLPQAAPAATMAEKLKAMMGSDDFSGAVGQIAGGMQGDNSAPEISPSSIGADGQQAAIAGAAAQLMASLMSRRKTPGLSLMGMGNGLSG